MMSFALLASVLIDQATKSHHLCATLCIASSVCALVVRHMSTQPFDCRKRADSMLCDVWHDTMGACSY